MKRKIAGIIGVLMFTAMLTGCGCQHQWKEATCSEPEICIKCGEEQGQPLGHKWLDADCENPKICSVCKEENGSPLGHDWNIDATIVQCKNCEETRDGTLDELFKSDEHNGIFANINDSGLSMTVTHTDKDITEKMVWKEFSDDIIEMVENIIINEGRMSYDTRTKIDGFCDLIIEDILNGRQDMLYDITKAYCGNNLDKVINEVYFNNTLMMRFENGKLKYNVFENKFGKYGYSYFYY